MEKEAWWKGAWRPASAAVYLVVCLFDFVIMPSIQSKQNSPKELVELAMKFKEPAVQIRVLETLEKGQEWTPLTTQGNGIFHFSFGAILGFAAHGRSREKIAKVTTGKSVEPEGAI